MFEQRTAQPGAQWRTASSSPSTGRTAAQHRASPVVKTVDVLVETLVWLWLIHRLGGSVVGRLATPRYLTEVRTDTSDISTLWNACSRTYVFCAPRHLLLQLDAPATHLGLNATCLCSWTLRLSLMGTAGY